MGPERPPCPRSVGRQGEGHLCRAAAGGAGARLRTKEDPGVGQAWHGESPGVRLAGRMHMGPVARAGQTCWRKPTGDSSCSTLSFKSSLTHHGAQQTHRHLHSPRGPQWPPAPTLLFSCHTGAATGPLESLSEHCCSPPRRASGLPVVLEPELCSASWHLPPLGQARLSVICPSTRLNFLHVALFSTEYVFSNRTGT